MPGPLPTPGSIRERRGQYRRRELPARGRGGRTPPWPLDGDPSPAEAMRWRALWRTPPAVMWAELGCHRTVARLARILVAAEQPGAARDVLTEARLLETSLGATPAAAARLGWVVVPDEAPAVPVDERRQEYRARAGWGDGEPGKLRAVED